MLYVLASDIGGLYYYEPGDKPGSYAIGKTNWSFAQERLEECPHGSSVIVFENAADAFRLGHFLALPGQKFEPREARTDDNLGPTVCLAKHGGGAKDNIIYSLIPTPSDATAGE